MNYGPIPHPARDYLCIVEAESRGAQYDGPPKGKLAIIDRLMDSLVIARVECLMECCEDCGGTGVIQNPYKHPIDPACEEPCPECQLCEIELERIKEEQGQL